MHEFGNSVCQLSGSEAGASGADARFASVLGEVMDCSFVDCYKVGIPTAVVESLGELVTGRVLVSV